MGGNAKFVILLAAVAAILYVLISPLPELAATNTLNFPVVPLMMVLLLQSLHDLLLAFVKRNTSTLLDGYLRSRNCVLLC